MTDLADKAYFTGKNRVDAIYVDKQFYRLYFRMADNSVTEVVMNASNGLGEWIESIQFPEGFPEAISAYIFGSTSEEEPDYGSLSAHGDQGILMLPEANGLYQDGRYIPEQVWVDGATGRLYMGQPDHWQVQLAGDAAGDVRIEGQHIYYRTTEGRAARILFVYGPDGMPIHERVQAGDDLSSFVKAREILGEGPFVRLQVRLGVIWTLDKDGTLRRDQETIARAVTSFVLDPLGVTYSSDGAIWRLPANGRCIKLATADAVAMAAADTYLYYSPTASGLWRMRLDGTGNRKLWDVSAEKIVYKYSVLAMLERDSGKIYLSANEDQLLETPYRSTDVDIGLYQGLVFIDEQTGGLKSVRFQLKMADGAWMVVTLE